MTSQLLASWMMMSVCVSLVCGYSIYADERNVQGRSVEGPKRDDIIFDEPYIPRMIGRSDPAMSARQPIVQAGRSMDKEIWDLLKDFSVVVISPEKLAEDIQSLRESTEGR